MGRPGVRGRGGSCLPLGSGSAFFADIWPKRRRDASVKCWKGASWRVRHPAVEGDCGGPLLARRLASKGSFLGREMAAGRAFAGPGVSHRGRSAGNG